MEEKTHPTRELEAEVARLRAESSDKSTVIATMLAQAEVRRSRSSREDWEVTLTHLLTQSAAATTRYYEAQKDVQGLALRVVEIETKKTRPDCDVPREFGTLPQPDQ
jgi:hypothetical protein